METPVIKITIVGVDKKLSANISDSIANERTYKYMYEKQLISRLRILTEEMQTLPEAEQINAIGNILIVERNIANFAAEQYAGLDQEIMFDTLTEIVSDIDELFE